jgi:hypothetical protein
MAKCIEDIMGHDFNIDDFDFGDPVQKNWQIYEKACKKFNLDPAGRLYSWQVEKVFTDYVENGGISCRPYTPMNIRIYRFLGRFSFWKKFWIHDFETFLQRLPVKFPHKLFRFLLFFRRKIFWRILGRIALKKSMKIWKSMKKNACYAGPDPRLKYKS